MVNPFYQSQYYLKSRIGSVGRSLGFRADTVGAWRIWRHELLAAMREALGVVRMVPTDPNPRLTDEVQREGYRRLHYRRPDGQFVDAILMAKFL